MQNSSKRIIKKTFRFALHLILLWTRLWRKAKGVKNWFNEKWFQVVSTITFDLWESANCERQGKNDERWISWKQEDFLDEIKSIYNFWNGLERDRDREIER